MGISQLKWECVHENMLCTQKNPAVYTIFSQPIKFKLSTQTFIQHTLCQHNILPVYTVLTQCPCSDWLYFECIFIHHLWKRCGWNVFSFKMGISQLKWECLHGLTQENMLCTQKDPIVYTIFSQSIKFKLGTQTFILHTLCQHNILPVYTVLTQCPDSDSDCTLSELVLWVQWLWAESFDPWAWVKLSEWYENTFYLVTPLSKSYRIHIWHLTSLSLLSVYKKTCFI